MFTQDKLRYLHEWRDKERKIERKIEMQLSYMPLHV